MAGRKVRITGKPTLTTAPTDNGSGIAVEQSTTELSDRDIQISGSDIDTATDTAIDPAGIGSDTGTDTGTRTRRKRRDAGKRRGSRKQAETEGAENLTAILLSLHMMGAALTSTPEIALTADEAEQLATAIARVNELYDGIILPEKTAAWINLAIAAGTVYGPRVIAIANKRKVKKPQPQIVDFAHTQEVN